MSTDGNTGNVEAMHDFSPPPALAGCDELTLQAERQVKRRCAKLLTLLWVPSLLITVAAFLFVWLDKGFSAGLGAGSSALITMLFVSIFAFYVVFFPFWWPLKNRLAKACSERRRSELLALGVQPANLYLWRDKGRLCSSLLALDVQRRLLYINLAVLDYENLVIGANEIRDVKVERESEVHTTTTHKGGFSFALFGSGVGAGYHADGKSHSKSVEVERAFLEIYYQRACDAAPRWVAIPFGGDRRAADSMAIAIRQL